MPVVHVSLSVLWELVVCIPKKAIIWHWQGITRNLYLAHIHNILQTDKNQEITYFKGHVMTWVCWKVLSWTLFLLYFEKNFATNDLCIFLFFNHLYNKLIKHEFWQLLWSTKWCWKLYAEVLLFVEVVTYPCIKRN